MPARAAALLAIGAAAACGGAPAHPTGASCPGDRAVVLASRADIARIAHCTVLAGVTIRSAAALDTAALAALATITGDLVIGPTVGIDEVTLGGLRSVGGAVRVVSNGLLQGVFLPRLERAGRIEIDGNVALTTVSLPRLARVDGAVRVTDNAELALLDLPALTVVDQALVLSADPKLALVDAGALRHAGSVALDVPELPPDVADRLRAAGTAPRP
jgi:hypothetical protein